VSDISIPGVTASKYGTDKLVEGLMKAERIPRDRADTDLKQYKKEQAAWREINQHTSSLRDTAKTLYSFNNPFTEKTAESTSERAVTASASREARDQSFKIAISQIAGADSFLSPELPKDGKVPKGDYGFTVGEKSVNFAWKGGSYKEFLDALNRRSTGLIRGSLIQVSGDTQSLLIESQKTGAKERLSFSGDALAFALNTGIIKKNDQGSITPSATSVTSLPRSNSVIDFSSPARARDGLVLEYTLTVTDSDDTKTADVSPSSPETGNPGSVTWGGLTVQNSPPELALSAAQPVPETPAEPVRDPQVLSLRTTKGIAVPLPAVPEGADKTVVSVPLSEYGDVNAILANNRNTGRTVSIDSIRIYDPKAAGEYTPVNPVSVAQDAMLKYEGISVTRKTNSIDDLVPGVTLSLNEPTQKTETITIKPDTKTAKESIIQMVASYNRVMADINILTQDKPEIITEIEYFTEDEKKAAEERLGMLMGDHTLNAVKASLQRITSNTYAPGEGNSLHLLAQIGISTRATAGAGVDATRLRGYLEIDEKKLDDALKNRMAEVKSLFGYDSDSDLVIDSGVGQALDSGLTPYVQTGGIFATRNTGLGNQISTTEKKIAQMDEQLKSKESELKSKYGQMEGTLNSLQNQSNSISNFSKQNSN